MEISEILETDYKDYCHYVIESRALPKITDGLKPVQRRSLWVAKKFAKSWTKVSKLAGATMGIHPHGDTAIQDSISNMAQDFAGANNVCFFDGDGSFGSRITGPGKGIASARYVSVRLSESFHNLFDVDSNLINMLHSYDETDVEPESFLPLVPAVLLNPLQGIAVGFACNILPRKKEDLQKAQIAYLSGKSIRRRKFVPYYEGFRGTIEPGEEGHQWICTGVYEKVDGRTLKITELPIGLNREQFVSHLDKLEESDYIKGYLDNCKDDFEFVVKMKEIPEEAEILKKFKLQCTLHENLTVIGFDGKTVLEKLEVADVVEQFTDWRFGFYLERFKKSLSETDDSLEFKKALLLVIEKGLFKKFPNQKKTEIIKCLKDQNIKNEHIKKIMMIPIYKFGMDEVAKLKEEIKNLQKEKEELEELVKSKDKRIEVYIKELKKI